MVLAAKAWQLREAARTAVAAGEFGRASELASKAQQAQSTRAGEVLLTLGEWLVMGRQ